MRAEDTVRKLRRADEAGCSLPDLGGSRKCITTTSYAATDDRAAPGRALLADIYPNACMWLAPSLRDQDR